MFLFPKRGPTVAVYLPSLGLVMLSVIGFLAAIVTIAGVVEYPAYREGGWAALGFSSGLQALAAFGSLAAIALVAVLFIASEVRRVRRDGERVVVESPFRKRELWLRDVRIELRTIKSDESATTQVVFTDGSVEQLFGEDQGGYFAAQEAARAIGAGLGEVAIVADDSQLARDVQRGDAYLRDYWASGRGRRDTILSLLFVALFTGVAIGLATFCGS